MKKVLILGGKPIGSCELVNLVHKHGDYAIVADYLPPSQSPAKAIADESWSVSTADVDKLVQCCQEANVDAVLTGIHEFNIARQVELCSRLNLPCYCGSEQIDFCEDKSKFKNACIEEGLPVSQSYSIEDAKSLGEKVYPLAVKPLDGNGSAGFSKVEDRSSLEDAISRAKMFSESKQVLIEDYVPGEAVIIHYSAQKGNIVFSGMSDKLSRKMGLAGSPIMALQIAPSVHESEYLEKYDMRVRSMLKRNNLLDGPIWIEAFYNDGDFIFNEIGYRFGGSMTPYLVEALSGINQFDLIYALAMDDDSCEMQQHVKSYGMLYGILPLHLRKGKIMSIQGIEKALEDKRLKHVVQVHAVSDSIEDWGSAKQVFAYLHFEADSITEIMDAMHLAKKEISVKGEKNEELLTSLFSPDESIGLKPEFLRQRCVGQGV